jgi:phage terminase large subunit-like protein
MYDLKECNISKKHSYLLEYYSKIKNGEIIAGYELIQELENLIEDLDDTEYIYDNNDAEFRINFIERFCKHTKSPFFGKPFILELWEKAFIEAFYSFKWIKTNLRRFKKAILLIARKNGKSTLCAAISLAEFFCGTGGNDIVCSSNDDAQAGIIFDEIANMREWSKALEKRSHKNNKGIFNLKNKSTIKKMSEKTQKKEGRNIDVGVVDEVHEMKDNSAVKPIEQSQSTKDEPILFEITTEGFVNDGYLDTELKYAREVLNKETYDPDLLVWLYTQDSETEIWRDKKSWQKSNPSLYDIKKPAYFEGQIRKAQKDKSERAFMMAKDFNIKQNNATAWLMTEEYVNDKTFDIEILRGCVGIGAVDLAETTDLLSARMTVMRAGDSTKYMLQKYFIPESKLEKSPDGVDYLEWAKKGFIEICPGNDNDFSYITNWFIYIVKQLGIRSYKIGYDNALAKYWVKDMIDTGFEMERIPQKREVLSNPMKLLEADLRGKLINYGANPIDKWCLGNTALDIDIRGLIMPIKMQGKPKNRIDGAVTMIIGHAVLTQYKTEYMSLVNG